MCFGSRDKDGDSAAKSRDIDRLIKQEEKRLSKEVKLLLLGECGNRGRLAAGASWRFPADEEHRR